MKVKHSKFRRLLCITNSQSSIISSDHRQALKIPQRIAKRSFDGATNLVTRLCRWSYGVNEQRSSSIIINHLKAGFCVSISFHLMRWLRARGYMNLLHFHSRILLHHHQQQQQSHFTFFYFFERTKIKFTAKLSRHSFVTAWLVSMLSHLFYFSLRFHFHIPNSRFSFASSQFQSERPRDRSESCFEYLFMWKLISMAHLPLPTSPFT